MEEEILFSKHDIFAVIEGQKREVSKRVEAIPANKLLNASEHDLVQALVEDLRLEVPVLKEDSLCVAHTEETKVDVSTDRYRMPGQTGAFLIPGNKTVIAVPYEGGEAEFFRIRPQVFGFSNPRAQISQGELLLTYVRTDQNAEALKRDYEGAVKVIGQCLASLSQLPSRSPNHGCGRWMGRSVFGD
jgi:hypothetical protein